MIRPRAVAVSAIDDYKLHVTFDNGECRIFDAAPLIKGSYFGQLLDTNYFSQVAIGGLSIEWPHGQDVCPDDLYYNSVPVKNKSK